MKNGNAATLGIMCLLILGASAYAAEASEQDSEAGPKNYANTPESMGLYLSVPSYLYAQNSTFGLQVGYQFKYVHLRLDMNFAEDYRDGKDIWFFIPSIGIFYSQDVQSIVRFYEGLTIGYEKGMVNSFDGYIGFANYIAGVEFLQFGNTTFFIEAGSGVSFTQKEGTYFGGTVIGGGFKYYF
ncbi:hypothetical protein MASR2M78_08090 [Treponema sp.]